ncbi:hypothetical protein KFL_002070150 [Klebsormidium nitens]|uniref:Uncharacterized protein n=1 Tax=Klebsormidium nitens TaxID=105231 RepID=A0A1Y1I1N0_KLENI|nr:hypothetical protein KFL_002070150 [Klebsormidium nitens]|eukprot:GAQ84820.1 hypothetical protein KFL_002070150 [Klebsormidium nitens]
MSEKKSPEDSSAGKGKEKEEKKGQQSPTRVNGEGAEETPPTHPAQGATPSPPAARGSAYETGGPSSSAGPTLGPEYAAAFDRLTEAIQHLEQLSLTKTKENAATVDALKRKVADLTQEKAELKEQMETLTQGNDALEENVRELEQALARANGELVYWTDMLRCYHVSDRCCRAKAGPDVPIREGTPTEAELEEKRPCRSCASQYLP